MSKDEWMSRLLSCRDKNALRLAAFAIASDGRQDDAVRRFCLCMALNLTESQLESACDELERVGIARLEWMQ